MDLTHGPDRALAERLERGEVVHYPTSPFPLPQGDELTFLLGQRLASRAHKNISYDPTSSKASGYFSDGPEQAERLRVILAEFSHTVTAWAAATFPDYARGWQLDRVSYRPEEEATRRLRLTARNDLLHVNAFPSRPTNGHRILRIFANINPTEPRVWMTSEPFSRLLARYQAEVGLPTNQPLSLLRQAREQVLGLFQSSRRRRSRYDSFMLEFHNFLKQHDDFQERCPKRFWEFQPGAVWLAMTDTASHAVLRGRFALEHSYFIAPETLALPDESPAAILQRACGLPVLNRAA